MIRALFFIVLLLLFFIYFITNQESKSTSDTTNENIIKKYNQLELTEIEKNYLTNKKNITMCIDPHWMPFEEIKNEKHIGITSDYVEIFRQLLGMPIELIVTTSWAESLKKAQQRECDIFPLVSKTDEREKYMDFTTPYINNPIVIATKVGVPFIESLDQIKDKKIAIVKGYSIYSKLQEDYPTLDIIEVDSLYKGLQKVEQNEIFAYLDNSTVINHEIQKSFFGNVTISGKINYNFEFSVATRNDHPLLHQIFQRVILSIDEKTKEKIFDKWIKVNYTIKTDYTLFYELLAVSLLIIFVTIYWNRKLSILNKELSLERDKAKKLTEAKSEFLANMSHEIRTPMHGIIGMSHLALESNLDEKSKNYVSKIDKSAKSLLNIINDILDFSKLEVEKLTIEKVEFSLNEVIENILNLSEVKINEKDLNLVVEYDTSKNEIFYGDPLRLTQVITNLMGNAIKFTQIGSVTLRIEKLSKNIVKFSIEDTGIGLSINQIDKLFESFTQADTSISRKYGGTGLGLSISKQLVELLGGKISVKSEERKGSVFSFEITLPQVYKYTEKKQEKLTDLKMLKEFFNNEKTFNILLVEDNLINQEIIKGLLANSKINIHLFQKEQEAVDSIQLNSTEYDLIFVNIFLDKELSQIQNKNNTKIPVIALGSDENMDKISFDDHIERPIDIEKLYKLLYKYLSQTTPPEKLHESQNNDDLNNMKYIDVDSALKRLNNNKKLYIKILNDFKSNYASIDFKKMTEEDFKLNIHTLKGLAGNIGADELYEILETINETNDKNLLDALDTKLKDVLDDLKNLSKNETTGSKEAISVKLQKELFEQLEKALENKRPKNINLAVTNIDKYILSKNDRLYFDKTKKYIYTYNYTEALKSLKFINF